MAAMMRSWRCHHARWASSWSSAKQAREAGARLPFVASDEIEAHLLAGLTAADDEARPVTLVQDREGARRVLQTLQALGPARFHACDTEVAQIDVKAVGPVGNGKVLIELQQFWWCWTC